MTRVGVVSTGRWDYGIWDPVLQALEADDAFDLRLFLGGAHLDAEFDSGREAEEAGYECRRVGFATAAETPLEAALAMGEATSAFARAFASERLDVLMVLGDRYEMHAAAAAATPLGIPLAHVHGGEISEGAIDDQLRHSITKLSHLHFAATEVYAQRIVRMGEEPWRVTVSGAPALDRLAALEPADPEAIFARRGVHVSADTVLVTYHPVTREPAGAERRLEALLESLAATGRPLIFTAPNVDPGRAALRERIESFVAGRADAALVTSFGAADWFGALSLASALVGNSSSGIIEAASFELPVVNVGERQAGRLRPRNVLDCPAQPDALAAALERALSPRFREELSGLVNPYSTGCAAERILARLRALEPVGQLLRKRFYEP